MGQRFGGRSNAAANPLACYVCGVRGHLARDCPQGTSASRGGSTSSSVNQSRFVQRGTSSNRSRGRRTRFSGLNVVYDAQGQEYPVDDNGVIYIAADEQTGANNGEQPQQENC